MKTEEYYKLMIGQWVQTMREFSGVPKFTEGMVIEDYGTGVTIAWDRPHNPIPRGMKPEEIAKMMSINLKCPLRDGFDKEDELPEMVIIVGKHYYNVDISEALKNHKIEIKS